SARVANRKKEHFGIYEDKAEQSITVFKHEDIPVSLGLVIDNSRSIEPRQQRLDSAGVSLVRQGNAEDKTFVVHFDDTAKLNREFTDSIPLLEETLSGMKPYRQTAIYDALVLALEHMQHAKHTKRAILLITDGIDNASTHTLK